MPVKRLNYFNHQFLRAEDFSTEQGYHLSMRRLHNSLLHTPGVADGLKVVFDTGATAVTVRQGTAIDKFGNEIILANDTRIELSGQPANAAVYITISYREELTDATNETGAQGSTRWTESFTLTPSVNGPSDPTAQIVLGRVVRGGAGGTVVSSVDETDRRYAGAVGGDMNTRTLSMKRDDVDPSRWPRLSCSEANQTALSNSDLRLDAGREILFFHTGQIRSSDMSHRIVFNRASDRLEFHESGDILFLTGAGTPTEKMRVTAAGNVGVGQTAPTSALHVGTNKSVRFELGVGTKLSLGPGAVEVDAVGVPAGRFVVTSAGNVGVAQVAPTSALHVGTGKSVRFELGTGARLSVGAPGTFEVDAVGIPGGRLFVANDGSVGVGTVTPRTRLDIGGGDFTWGRSRLVADQGGSIELGGDNATGGGGSPYIDFHFLNLTQDYNVRLQNDADGRLSLYGQRFQIGGDVGGVGLQPSDASPNAGYVRFGDGTGWKLHFGRSREGSGGALNAGAGGVLMSMQDNGNVSLGTTDTTLARLAIAGVGSWNTGILLTGNTMAGVGLALENRAAGGQKYSILTGGSGITLGPGGFGIFNDTTGLYRLVIDRDGQVGIGTGTDPLFERLQVNGNVYIFRPQNGPAELRLYNGGAVAEWTLRQLRADAANPRSHNLYISKLVSGAYSDFLTVDPSGNLGVGTTDTSAARLTVAGVGSWNTGLLLTGNTASGVGLALENKQAGGHKYSILSGGVGTGVGIGGFGIFDDTANKYRLGIDRDGNVGIGTHNPSRILHTIGSEIHSGGSGAGFSFNNRESADFGGGDGNRWVWYSSGNIARLWANGDRFTFAANGDATFSGRIGTNGYSATPRTPGWGGGIRTWDLEVEASAWCRNGWQTGPRDLAENYNSDKDLSAGDVVSMDAERDLIVPSSGANDTMVMGVVSTHPGMLLNSDPVEELERKDGTLAYPVALCGRVPCKVTDENGPIKRGDLLTSSSTPGHAMKAAPVYLDGQEFYRPGTIIGKALEPFGSGRGMIEVFVSLR